MTVLIAAVLGALVLGWVLGGSLDRLGGVRLRQRWLVVAAVLVQLVGTLAGGAAFAVGLLTSGMLALAFLMRNRGVAGMGLITLGVLSNALVVAANGAMPVSLWAAEQAGAEVGVILVGDDPRHEVADSSTQLPWLADVIPVRAPIRPEVVSIGDVLLSAGIAQLIVAGMVTGPRSRRRRRGRRRTRARIPLPSRPSSARAPSRLPQPRSGHAQPAHAVTGPGGPPASPDPRR